MTNEHEFTTERVFNAISGVGVKITDYHGHEAAVHVPLRLNKLLVLYIGEYAFSKKQLEMVTLPNSIKNICHGAFAHNKLIDIEIPLSVTYVGPQAFEDNQLTNILIQSHVETIGTKAFAGNHLSEIEIPNSVTLIGRHAFYGNPLKSVTIGADVYIEKDDLGYEGFCVCYTKNGKSAGVYVCENDIWTKKG